MAYKIIGDSCLDLTKELKRDTHFQLIPLTLQVDDVQVTDDENFNQAELLKLVKESPNYPKTACPSPDMYKCAYECEEEDIYVITLSEHLSGSHNSAMVGKQLYEEEHGKKNIFVLSSDSASSGQLLLALYIKSLCDSDRPFDEVVELVTEFRNNMKTYFVLENLDTLRKNGRLSGLQAFFATALNIKPVMGAENGVIIKLDQARGINKALNRMVDIAINEAGDTKGKIAVIAHCNNLKRAVQVREEMAKKAEFKDIVITETAGVATIYAGDGGIILAI